MPGSFDETLPPRPPQMPRRVRVSGSLAIGIPLLVLLLMLVILRVFGERMERVELSVGQLQVEVQFPARLRKSMRSAIKVDVRNVGERTVQEVELEFDRDYLEHFNELIITPAADWPYVIVLPELPSGHRHRIVVEVRAHKIGRRSGLLTVRLPGSDEPAAIELRTFTFP